MGLTHAVPCDKTIHMYSKGQQIFCNICYEIHQEMNIEISNHRYWLLYQQITVWDGSELGDSVDSASYRYQINWTIYPIITPKAQNREIDTCTCISKRMVFYLKYWFQKFNIAQCHEQCNIQSSSLLLKLLSDIQLQKHDLNFCFSNINPCGIRDNSKRSPCPQALRRSIVGGTCSIQFSLSKKGEIICNLPAHIFS